MRFSIDTDERSLTVHEADADRVVDLYSPAAFEILSREWVRVGWAAKYQYTFTWLGRPLIQLPEDVLRIQEVVHQVQPDVIIETGVAHGGSLVLYASLFEAMGHGRVIGVDIEIRPHNRQAIEAHRLAHRIQLVEGDAVSPEVVEVIRGCLSPDDKVLVILDSNHTRSHVAAELEAYGPLVTPGSYVVATDGIMFDLADVPRAGEGWETDNPRTAALDFVRAHPEFELVEPPWAFNESDLTQRITHWPDAYLRRR